MTETIHQPRHSFAKEGPRVLGFARTELDRDEVASRKNQTERIRAYASDRGMCEPYVLPTAARADLYKQATTGSVIVTTRLANLLRKPSDVDDLLRWIVANNIKLHVMDMGADEVSGKLSTIRQVSECYAPLEREIETMRQAATDMEKHHASVLNEAVGRVVHTMTAKFMGLKSEVTEITNAARAAVTDPVLRERRERAAQMVEQMQERQRQIDNAEEWHAQGATRI